MIIEVFGKKDCEWCDQATDLLTSSFMDYDYHTLDADSLEMLKETPGWNRKVPAIFIDGVYVGGYTDLLEWMYRDKWL